MSSISSINAADSLALYLNQLNASETKVSDTTATTSTDTSAAIAAANGVESTSAVSATSESSSSGTGSDSGSGSSSSDSQTTIERSVSRGEDGSMIITLTEVTTNSDGSTSSKVLSRMKMSSSTEGLLGSDSDNNYLNADSQMMLDKAQSSVQSNASSQYEQNSIVGSYMAGLSVNLNG